MQFTVCYFHVLLFILFYYFFTRHKRDVKIPLHLFEKYTRLFIHPLAFYTYFIKAEEFKRTAKTKY